MILTKVNKNITYAPNTLPLWGRWPSEAKVGEGISSHSRLTLRQLPQRVSQKSLFRILQETVAIFLKFSYN